MIKSVAAFAGPVLAVGLSVLPTPEDLSPGALAVASVGLLMAIWWMTEAIPLPVTALLPLILFPALGLARFETVAQAYAHPLIFLFFGGFLLAQAMQRWNLNERAALHVLRFTGDRPAGVIAGIMMATAFLSMWVSNTATAMMMLPIGLSITLTARQNARGQAEKELSEFSGALMLAIAYAATIGGMGTLIGTPPNALFAGFMSETYGLEIGFVRWMSIGVPAVLILLPVAWLTLTRIVFRLPAMLPGDGLRSVPPGRQAAMSSGARRALMVLLLAALSWMLRPLLQQILPGIGLSDTAVALVAAVALFIVPSGGARGETLLAWEDAKRIRWDVLILFGGGLALAEAISTSGLAVWIGATTAGLSGMPMLLLLLVIAAVVVLVGELGSNTAMAAIFIPVATAAAVGLGAHPVALALPVALAASLGFMLPVATPPNAIIYGSGAVPVQHMLRAGLLLDVVGVAIVAFLGISIGPWAFGLK